MATPSSSSPPSSSATPSSITLHILSPAPEVAGGRITFQSISLDTTILQLKARLQNSIPAKPPPERQRLIYRGRPLVDGSLSLKNVFQSELDANNTSSNHTLHLVLPPTPPSNNTYAIPSVTATIPTATQVPPNVPQLAHQPHHGPQFPHHAIAQAQAAQMILQNQLNLLQQQLSINNPVHVSAEQMAQMQAQHHLRLAQQMAIHQQQQHLAQHQHHHHYHQAQQEQARQHPGMQDTRNTEQSAHVNSSQANQTSQGPLSATPTPTGPTTTTIHEGIGPSGSRMRVVVNETVNYHVSRQGTPVPTGPGQGQPPPLNFPFPSPHAFPNFPFVGPPSGPLPPAGFSLPPPNPHLASSQPSSASAHGQHSDLRTSQPPSANTTAWLLSTPLGPQALVFAPGHGYFSSAPTPTTARLTPSNRSTSHHGTRHPRQLANDRAGHGPGLPNPPLLPAEDGVNVAQPRFVARPGEQQRRANNNENDLFHLILQRGWLFLRLYIFMFVLSEPGTWRRWILLGVAVIVCFLPRQNPLHDLANRIRAHIDGLVPVAAAPEQRQQDQAGRNGAQVAGNEGQTRPAAGSAAQQPSPEQAAARIIRQNQERQNHGIVRDTIFRVERAMALFLASLVPGVGERHVRAREEARREAERIENERLATENARAAGENVKDESKAVADGMEQRQEILDEPSTSNHGEHEAAASSSS